MASHSFAIDGDALGKTRLRGWSDMSSSQVHRIELDGSIAAPYAVGRYLDRIGVHGGKAVLAGREVRLDTRRL